VNQEHSESSVFSRNFAQLKKNPERDSKVIKEDEARHFFAFVARYRVSLKVIMANEETDKCLYRGSGETLSAGTDWTDNRERQLFGHVDHVGSVDPRPLSAFQPCRNSHAPRAFTGRET